MALPTTVIKEKWAHLLPDQRGFGDPAQVSVRDVRITLNAWHVLLSVSQNTDGDMLCPAVVADIIGVRSLAVLGDYRELRAHLIANAAFPLLPPLFDRALWSWSRVCFALFGCDGFYCHNVLVKTCKRSVMC